MFAQYDGVGGMAILAAICLGVPLLTVVGAWTWRDWRAMRRVRKALLVTDSPVESYEYYESKLADEIQKYNKTTDLLTEERRRNWQLRDNADRMMADFRKCEADRDELSADVRKEHKLRKTAEINSQQNWSLRTHLMVVANDLERAAAEDDRKINTQRAEIKLLKAMCDRYKHERDNAREERECVESALSLAETELGDFKIDLAEFVDEWEPPVPQHIKESEHDDQEQTQEESPPSEAPSDAQTRIDGGLYPVGFKGKGADRDRDGGACDFSEI